MNSPGILVLPAASPCAAQTPCSVGSGSEPIENASANPAKENEIKSESEDSKSPHRKIGKLPRPLRDLVNSLLEDGQPARKIIARLQDSTDPPLPYAISEKNVSDWRQTGYRQYLAQQERLAVVRANREGAAELVAEDDLTTLPEATLQIVANQYYEFLADFSPESLKEKLSEDPLKYTRFLNVFARLVREIVYLRKFRDASAKDAAAQLKELDPDRDLADKEFELLANRMDRVFKVARRRKPGNPIAPANPDCSAPAGPDDLQTTTCVK